MTTLIVGFDTALLFTTMYLLADRLADRASAEMARNVQAILRSRTPDGSDQRRGCPPARPDAGDADAPSARHLKEGPGSSAVHPQFPRALPPAPVAAACYPPDRSRSSGSTDSSGCGVHSRTDTHAAPAGPHPQT